MKLFVTLTTIFTLLTTQGMAEAPKDAIVLDNLSYGCIVSIKEKAPSVSYLAPMIAYDEGYYLVSSSSLPTCKSVKELKQALSGTALGLQLVGIGLACTGVGTTVTVLVNLTAIGVRYVELRVGDLDCRDLETEAKIKKAATESTCEVLKSVGIECDPKQVKEKPFTPLGGSGSI